MRVDLTPRFSTDHLLANGQSSSFADAAVSDTLLQTDAQGLLDYTQTLTDTGEELMFTMDIPYVPIQDTPVVWVQASGSSATKPDYLLKTCNELSSGAEVWVTPAGRLAVYLGNQNNRNIFGDRTALASIKITLLDAPKHGTFTSDSSGQSYLYIPEPGYLGNDKAAFMAEFEGKRYKIVANLVISIAIDDNMPQCPESTLIKLNHKLASGSSEYNLNSISVTVANLDGVALGQATGTSITLDDNAAGHNWFIDTTPADNSEFLPTSNPYEWVAKEGSAAYGKMDMLSGLLHEYGHALGIEHSADSHDYTVDGVRLDLFARY